MSTILSAEFELFSSSSFTFFLSATRSSTSLRIHAARLADCAANSAAVNPSARPPLVGRATAAFDTRRRGADEEEAEEEEEDAGSTDADAEDEAVTEAGSLIGVAGCEPQRPITPGARQCCRPLDLRVHARRMICHQLRRVRV
jgi:hypothetical protein